jgi:Carbohydrate-binding domain-containing protein Cthe_2159
VKTALALVMALTLMLGAAGCTDQQGLSAGTTGGSQTSSTVAVGMSTSSSTDSSTGSSTESTAAADEDQTATAPSAATIVSYSDTDLDARWDTSAASYITLAGGSARLDGTGGTAEGSTVKITAGGTYVVGGTLDDGQIIVDLEEDDTVRLVLNGADISCSDSAPIYVKNADKVVIILADGTENVMTDGESYVLEDEEAGEPNAAIFSRSDLVINGTGSLTVDANYNNGIASKDDLKIVSGTITVDAVNDGLKGRDCIGVLDGTITVTAAGDGLQSTNDEDPALGYISIEGGTLDIASGMDGIQAQTTLAVLAGDITLSTGGGSANSSSDMGQGGNTWGDWGPGQGSGSNSDDTDSASAKGLKAAVGVYVVDGTITIDSSDDSVHSDTAAQIDGGTLAMTSGDDGIHADGTLEINGGELSITQSYEGIESGVITINGGTIHVVASDDAINVAGGVDESSTSGRPGAGDFTVNENNQLHINGGYVFVDGNGDGLDCNGRVFMTGGTVIVNGPTNNGNGAIDYLGEFTVSGGYLLAVGSSGMAQSLSDSSTQYSVLINFDNAIRAGTMVHLEDEDGNDILTFVPTKQYQSVCLCSPDITEGSTLTIYLSGSSTGAETDGLYSGGTYSPGTESTTLEITGVVNTLGGGGMMQGGGFPGGGGPPPGGGRP